MIDNRHSEESPETQNPTRPTGSTGKPKEDLIFFVRLSAEETGLSHTIMVDNSMSYIEHHHPLWLYVELGEENYGIVTIEQNPKVLQGEIDNAELSKITCFIHANHGTLQDFADKKLLGKEFYGKLIPLGEGKEIRILKV